MWLEELKARLATSPSTTKLVKLPSQQTSSTRSQKMRSIEREELQRNTSYKENVGLAARERVSFDDVYRSAYRVI